MVKSRTYIATPPGATIKEQLEDRDMSQKEFAIRMDLSEKHVSKLIHGEVALTPDVAERLELVLGVPAKFWNNLEIIYREKILKANAENHMEQDIEIVRKLPYREMAKNGWIPDTRKSTEKVIHLRKFFEVVQLTLIEDEKLNKIACRRLSSTSKSDYALLAWAQQAKREARSRETAPINLKYLKDSLPTIRAMTPLSPEVFAPNLIQLLSNCGIALIFLPHIGGSFLHGATLQDGNKIVMGLTVRGKYADKFWFSLFHEIGHILNGHLNQPQGTSKEDEDAADQFAKDILIPEQEFQMIVSKGDFSRNALLQYAVEFGIDVGILVGRLQKEELIGYTDLNDLRSKYELK